MLAFPIVFVSVFAGIFGVIALAAARVVALLTGKNVEEIIEEWTE